MCNVVSGVGGVWMQPEWCGCASVSVRGMLVCVNLHRKGVHARVHELFSESLLSFTALLVIVLRRACLCVQVNRLWCHISE